MPGLPDTRSEREALVRALHRDIDAAVRLALGEIQPKARRGAARLGGDLKLLDGCLRSLLYLEFALREIDKRGLGAWRLPILSWLSLGFVEWIDDAERERFTDRAFADDGALWWAEAFEVVLPEPLAPLSWTSFLGPTATHFSSNLQWRWCMYLWPFIAGAGQYGRSIELWAIEQHSIDAWPADGWRYVLELRIHATPRGRGGAARGALPDSGLTVRLVPPGLPRSNETAEQERSYFRDVDALQALPEPATATPDHVARPPVETLCAGMPPVDLAILLATYFLRANLGSSGKGRGREQLQNYRKAILIHRVPQLAKNADLAIDETQLDNLAKRLDDFRHPRQKKSLQTYLRKTIPRVLPNPESLPPAAWSEHVDEDEDESDGEDQDDDDERW